MTTFLDVAMITRINNNIAAVIHDAWVVRQKYALSLITDEKKAEDALQPESVEALKDLEALFVPFGDLLPVEQDKDLVHVTIALHCVFNNVRGEKKTKTVEQIANEVGSMLHEKWREDYKKRDGDVPRMKMTTNKGNVDINVKWALLHDEWKHDNFQAGLTAAHLVIAVYGPLYDAFIKYNVENDQNTANRARDRDFAKDFLTGYTKYDTFITQLTKPVTQPVTQPGGNTYVNSKKNQANSYTITTSKINTKHGNRNIYVGKRGGKYVKINGEFVSVTKL